MTQAKRARLLRFGRDWEELKSMLGDCARSRLLLGATDIAGISRLSAAVERKSAIQARAILRITMFPG
ncbi:hypothetical protein D3C80_1827310 [compost metagenome]